MTPREQKYFEQGRLHGLEQHGTNPAAALRKPLADALKCDENEALRRTIASYKTRLDSLPAAAKYPELQGMRGCVEAYNQGLAHGTGVSLDDIIVRANFIHMITDSLRVSAPSPAHPDQTPGCTLVYFPHSDRGPLLANNQDGLASHVHRIPPPPIVANRAGLIVGTVSSGLYDDEISPEPFPAPVYLMLYELCSTTSQAIDLLTRLNLFWGPNNTLIADRHGQSAVIEKSTCRFGLRQSSDGFSATTEMSAEDPAYKNYLWQTRERSLIPRKLGRDSVDWAYWKTCERRSARLLKLVEKARKKPTFSAIEEIIYDHDGLPEQIHMDGGKCHPEQEHTEWSIRSTIWVLSENGAQVSFADPPRSSRDTPREWVTFEQPHYIF